MSRSEVIEALFAQIVESNQLGQQYLYVRTVLERFLEDAEFRPNKEGLFARVVNDIMDPLRRNSNPGGSWARAVEKLSTEENSEVNIGVFTSKADIQSSTIFVDVGLPSSGPSVTVPGQEKFAKLDKRDQFQIILEAAPWVNILAKNFAPDLIPLPPNSSLTPASLN